MIHILALITAVYIVPIPFIAFAIGFAASPYELDSYKFSALFWPVMLFVGVPALLGSFIREKYAK